ncbi:MAG: hypothetical protein WAO28_01080 [Candidatus Microsaccharimonas sp.]
MDLFIGIVIGLALAGGVFGIVVLIKRRNAAWENSSTSSSRDEREDRRDTSREDAERSLATREAEAKNAAYRQMRDKYDAATTREEYVALQTELEAGRSKLAEADYDSLVSQIESEIEALDEEARARAEIEPKLAAFAALKNVTDKEELFTKLHPMFATDETPVITYDELEEHAEEGDLDWLDTAYDEALIEHLKALLIAAREGTVADYKAVTKLWDELEDYSSNTYDDRDDLVSQNLATEWNEMIVRFKREPDYDEDLYGLDDLDEDGYKAIIKKAREDHDLLSLRLLFIIVNEWQDSDFTDLLVASFTEELQAQLDAQYLALGFTPNEQERSV